MNKRILEMTAIELLAYGFRPWDESNLMLIPKHMLDNIPTGTKVTDIFGKHYIVGKDVLDLDTRGGMLAYGIYPKSDLIMSPSTAGE